MKKAFLALMLLAAAPAQAMTTCPPLGKASIEVALDYTPAQEDKTKSVAQLSQLAQGRGYHIYGLTLRKLDSDFAGDFVTYTRDNAVCLAPRKVLFTIHYAPRVFIASDFLQMACMHGVTMMHENRHVQTTQLAIKKYIPEIESAMQGYFAALDTRLPVAATAQRARQEEILRGAATAANAAFAQMLAYERDEQGKIDSPEGYARDNAVCPHEIPPSVRAQVLGR